MLNALWLTQCALVTHGRFWTPIRRPVCYPDSVTESLPDYRNLDLSGEASTAAGRMEARAQEPASVAMFDTLIAPLLGTRVRDVLDIGCGTSSLARRIGTALPEARVRAVDKSAGMLKVAAHLAREEGLSRIDFQPWDVVEESSFPFGTGTFDLIVSSVMTVYLSDEEVVDLIGRLVRRLKPGGMLAFVEQDLMSDAVNDASGMFIKIVEKDKRAIKPTMTLGLGQVMREAGLRLLPRISYLWTDDRYGPYTRELLERFADSASGRGTVSAAEAGVFKDLLRRQAEEGCFYYGLVYHRIAGTMS